MKNLPKILSVLAIPLLFLSAGCASQGTESVPVEPVETTTTTTATITPENPWRLAFTLPDGWVMTEGCTLKDEKVSCGAGVADNDSIENIPALDLEIDPAAEVVYLQNTEKLPLFGGVAPSAPVQDYYQQENLAVIAVNVLSPIAEMPADSVATEDLGNGFSKVTTCDLATNPECTMYGASPFDYYLVTDDGEQFRFTFSSNGVADDVIEEIILSAKE